MVKQRIIVSFASRVPKKEEVKILIDKARKEETKKAISLAFNKGLKINQILEQVNVPRRTLQERLRRISIKEFNINFTFETIRQRCLLELFNKGYSPEYISKFLGYSRKDMAIMRRREAGYISNKIRLSVLRRDNFSCVFCKSNKVLEIDHIIPVSKGGKSNKNNLQTLCRACNSGKGVTRVYETK